MNKGMIMEVKKSYVIALNDNGMMEKIKFKPNMEVGQKIFYFEDDIVTATASKVHRHNNFIKTFGSIAALFLLVFTFFSTIRPEQAFAVVSIDINPSIQIEADSKQKIIKVDGVNDDGKKIDFSDIKDISLDEGMQKIKEKLVEKNYLEANKEVLVGVAFIKNGDTSGYEENLQAAIRTTFNTEDITYVKADKEEVDEAKTENISLGRYKAKETASVDEATKDKMGKAPVKEITALIKDKENVIQWEAKEEQKPAQIPTVETKPEVKPEKPAVDSRENTNAGRDKPVINVPSENADSNTDKNTDKEGIPSKPKNNDVLELEPEKPVTPEKGNTPSKVPDDSGIIIAPNNGTSENNTTSGKTPEETKVPSSTIQIEPKTDGVNKETKN
ncbi:anti-sigma-I factor RsgI [Clostridium puniceum]|uniref:Anti-sigma-I factor RsgI n=1 Tax=Clostridium puniceum TaxID=29367 RepID=A0A1S8SYV5_9CLOT|nr:anti-sigma factor domain-containing protein [Clostridium puniceum]OOM70474.1 anti-sigma-I factor RsgI [Clostridium puniceum]